jgi:hypothetical protein
MVDQAMRSLGVAMLLVLVLAAPAAASECVAPPGTAAIEQYCEIVPSATGDSGGSSPAPDRSSTPALRAQGADGRALANVLGSDRTGSASGSRGKQRTARSAPRHGHRAAARATAARDEPAPNPLRAVTSAVQAGPTLGGGFAWVLLGITALMLAAGWLRLRRGRS